MSTKTLKRFQELAVQSGAGPFHARQGATRRRAGQCREPRPRDHHNGYLLIEAPTGAGKTLMAGNITGGFRTRKTWCGFGSRRSRAWWGQTAGFLREQFHRLRLREMQEDRGVAGSRGGDVFVMTWATVATHVKDNRNVRKDGKLKPSVDELVNGLRAAGLRIGVVVDEAHHGFHGEVR